MYTNHYPLSAVLCFSATVSHFFVFPSTYCTVSLHLCTDNLNIGRYRVRNNNLILKIYGNTSVASMVDYFSCHSDTEVDSRVTVSSLVTPFTYEHCVVVQRFLKQSPEGNLMQQVAITIKAANFISFISSTARTLFITYI